MLVSNFFSILHFNFKLISPRCCRRSNGLTAFACDLYFLCYTSSQPFFICCLLKVFWNSSLKVLEVQLSGYWFYDQTHSFFDKALSKNCHMLACLKLRWTVPVVLLKSYGNSSKTPLRFVSGTTQRFSIMFMYKNDSLPFSSVLTLAMSNFL